MDRELWTTIKNEIELKQGEELKKEVELEST